MLGAVLVGRCIMSGSDACSKHKVRPTAPLCIALAYRRYTLSVSTIILVTTALLLYRFSTLPQWPTILRTGPLQVFVMASVWYIDHTQAAFTLCRADVRISNSTLENTETFSRFYLLDIAILDATADYE